MVEKEAWTPLKMLKWTIDFFKKHGVEEPRLDAELLLAKALGVERIMLYAGFERVLTDEELARFREMVKDRAAGRPAKYIIGATEFRSLPFLVDERVLIPRSDTELLVDLSLSFLARMQGVPATVVEIGTGSGAVIVSIAKGFAGPARFIATDISEDALEIAVANADVNSVTGIEFLAGDLFEPLKGLGLEGNVDLLVSNPPYVRETDFESLAREIREYEPRGALVSGPLGTEVHERILDGARAFLRTGGALMMEMDNSQKAGLEVAAARFPEYTLAAFHQDYAHLWRVVEVRRT